MCRCQPIEKLKPGKDNNMSEEEEQRRLVEIEVGIYKAALGQSVVLLETLKEALRLGVSRKIGYWGLARLRARIHKTESEINRGKQVLLGLGLVVEDIEEIMADAKAKYCLPSQQRRRRRNSI